MPKAVPLRTDYSAEALRRIARESRDANQTRRLLALAGVADGLRRQEAARIGDVDMQAVRRWILAFNDHGPDGLIDRPPPGRPPKLSTAQKQDLAELVETGPDPEVDGVVRWRCVDLQAIIRDRYGVTLNEASVGRVRKALHFAPVSARPQHPRQDSDPIEAFKKRSA